MAIDTIATTKKTKSGMILSDVDPVMSMDTASLPISPNTPPKPDTKDDNLGTPCHSPAPSSPPPVRILVDWIDNGYRILSNKHPDSSAPPLDLKFENPGDWTSAYDDERCYVIYDASEGEHKRVIKHRLWRVIPHDPEERKRCTIALGVGIIDVNPTMEMLFGCYLCRVREMDDVKLCRLSEASATTTKKTKSGAILTITRSDKLRTVKECGTVGGVDLWWRVFFVVAVAFIGAGAVVFMTSADHSARLKTCDRHLDMMEDQYRVLGYEIKELKGKLDTCQIKATARPDVRYGAGHIEYDTNHIGYIPAGAKLTATPIPVPSTVPYELTHPLNVTGGPIIRCKRTDGKEYTMSLDVWFGRMSLIVGRMLNG